MTDSFPVTTTTLAAAAAGLAVLLLHRYFVHERNAIPFETKAVNRRRRIFITGAASGIGRETAKLFHARGWTVGVADLNLAAAQQLVQDELQGAAGSASAHQLDVTSADSCQRALDEFCSGNNEDDNEGLDALFNSAGLLAIGMFGDLPLPRQTQQIRVNLEGLVNMTYVALPRLVKQKQSVVVSMASASSMSGIPTHAVYAASKAAVYSLTEALAIELHGQGVRVADVSVGYVGSPMLLSQESRDSLMLAMPYITPKEVAETVYRAAIKARLHREHFYVEYSTAFFFKLQGLCRALGVRLHMCLVSFMCMPRK